MDERTDSGQQVFTEGNHEPFFYQDVRLLRHRVRPLVDHFLHLPQNRINLGIQLLSLLLLRLLELLVLFLHFILVSTCSDDYPFMDILL